MGLGKIFGATTETLPADVPYIAAPPDRIDTWRDTLARPGVKVGLAWAGRPTHPQDAQRSMDSDLFAPLASIDGVRLYSLQKDTTTRPLAPALDARARGHPVVLDDAAVPAEDGGELDKCDGTGRRSAVVSVLTVGNIVITL